MENETKVYSDGTVVIGPAPLPDLSPAQQDELEQNTPAVKTETDNNSE